jgi:plastocyanin
MFRHGRVLLALLGAAATASGSAAQTVLDRTPNLSGAWVGVPGVLHFNFLHRFSISSAPERKVTSTPTFLMAASLPKRTLLGVHYATNSELSPRYPNEWEFFGRFAPLNQESGAPLDASVQVGYNIAAEGFDGELAAARRQGRLRLLAGLRVLSDPAEGGGADVVFAGGLVFRLTRYVGLSGDIVSLAERAPDERVAWSAGLNLSIPNTPHTLSLHATNANNATLQSSSRGTGETRYGFEFTIPLTLSRYFGSRRPQAASPPPAGVAAPVPAGGRDTVTAAIQDFTFQPGRIEVDAGTTVVWTNGGQVSHSVTSEQGGFDTGLLEPAERRGLTFSKPGTYPFHCTPHPFMTGVIVVR